MDLMSLREIALMACWAVASAIGVTNVIRLRGKDNHSVRVRREILSFLVFGLVIPLGVFGRPPHLDVLPFSMAIIILVVGFFALLLSSRVRRSSPQDG
jgi:hypothetical protein